MKSTFRLTAADNSNGDDDETLKLLLCQCPAFSDNRSQILVKDSIPDLNHLVQKPRTRNIIDLGKQEGG